MYPFRILLVKTDDGILMRVVYQSQNERYPYYISSNINNKYIKIETSACPEWAIYNSSDPTIYLRGYVDNKHHVPVFIHDQLPTDELIEELNNKLKLTHQPTD